MHKLSEVFRKLLNCVAETFQGLVLPILVAWDSQASAYSQREHSGSPNRALRRR